MVPRIYNHSKMSELEPVKFDILDLDLSKHPDLKMLAASTTAAFEAIAPWCQKHSDLQYVSSITTFEFII
jgi:hypothetical protein